jgi:hypothetical protein
MRRGDPAFPSVRSVRFWSPVALPDCETSTPGTGASADAPAWLWGKVIRSATSINRMTNGLENVDIRFQIRDVPAKFHRSMAPGDARRA